MHMNPIFCTERGVLFFCAKIIQLVSEFFTNGSQPTSLASFYTAALHLISSHSELVLTPSEVMPIQNSVFRCVIPSRREHLDLANFYSSFYLFMSHLN